jgi:hypothetical protein
VEPCAAGRHVVQALVFGQSVSKVVRVARRRLLEGLPGTETCSNVLIPMLCHCGGLLMHLCMLISCLSVFTLSVFVNAQSTSV